jgi:two-component system, NtrC family, sensor kinase
VAASLFVIQGRDQGTRFELDGQSVAFPLGRDTGNHIQLHDTEVSRRHAELRRSGDVFLLSDLGSSNGTFVNNQRVQQRELASGDQVQIGRTVMLFTGLGEAPSSTLGAQVNIVGAAAGGDNSRILHSVSREEGSRIFSPDFTIGADASQGQWLARARSNLQIMYRTALAVSHTLDIDQLLKRIMELIFEWVEADRGCIMLLDPESKQLRPKVRRDRKGLRSDEKITISSTILDYVMQRCEGVLTSDATQDDRFDTAASIVHGGVREAICVPMQGRYDVVGLIYIDTSTPPGRALDRLTGNFSANKFTEEHLKLMVAIGHQAALAVEDTNYYSAMVQAERLAAVGQTIASLSHHIKNILQGVRGGSYLIEMGLAEHDEEVVGKGWYIVERNQRKISALVMDMLTFSKEREPEFAAADLNAVVGEVIELMQSRADELKVQLRWEADATIPRLTFDSEGIQRAVLNIVTNALDACDTHEAGVVTVRTERLPDAGTVQVSVEDNGSGIDPENLKQIFNPFFSSKGARGTGLGLAVSQKILKEHGGRIHVESRPGEGSHFTLELPAMPAEEESAGRAPGDTSASTADGRVIADPAHDA